MCLAIPGKILSVAGEEVARLARVDFGGVVREVNLCYVPEAQVGDYVIVHGFVVILRMCAAYFSAAPESRYSSMYFIDSSPEDRH